MLRLNLPHQPTSELHSYIRDVPRPLHRDAALLIQQFFQPRIVRVHGMRRPIITYCAP